MPERFEVIIVGGGPVGVALAVDLGLRGISCAVIERRTELSSIPKGQGLQQRTMEHFYFWGLEKELRAARTLSPDHPIGNMTAYKTLLDDVWDAPPGREVIAPYYFQKNERLPQYRTEMVLRERMKTLPAVHDYFGYSATGLSQDADGVTVTIEKDGQEQVLAGDYLVGCDGGHSMVRDTSGIERTGSNFNQVMALVVFHSAELHEATKRFGNRATTYRVMHPDLEGYWMFFGRIDDDGGFFFHAPIPAPQDPDTADIAALLHRAGGFDFNFEIDHLGFWDLRVQVAEKYRNGRIFIAGDAAHTHPPYGGFGLNNGLEDVTNLGWKLWAVLRGWAPETLLDSYSPERQPVFKDIGENVIAAGILEERDFLRAHSPEIDGLEEFKALFKAQATGFGRKSRLVETHYDGSPIVAAAPGAVTGSLGSHELIARTGHHLGPLVLSTGANVFTELGPGYTLLDLGADSTTAGHFQAAADALGVPLKVVRDDNAALRDEYKAELILVRPDQFIAWTNNEPEQDPARIIDIVTGR